MSNSNSDDKKLPKDLLEADLKYLAEAFWKNESSGETRVKFLFTFLTAVISALVALATTVKIGKPPDPGLAPWIDITKVTWISVFALGSMLLLGLITFFQLVGSNCLRDEHKAASDYVRRCYRELYKSTHFQGYEPFPRMPTGRPSIGSFAQMVAVINGMILGAFVFMLKAQPFTSEATWTPPPVSILVAFALGLFAVVIQIAWAQRKRRVYADAIRARYMEIGLPDVAENER
jgi:hypothetical protein